MIGHCDCLRASRLSVPRRPRIATAGLIFHVVNRAAKRAQLFENDADYHAFECLLIAAVTRIEVAIFSYCIMPNHWHLVLSPRVDGALSRFMHWLTTTHARRWQLARGLDGQGAVYQGRYRAVAVREDAHFLWVCRYVERNALRASLVARAEDWRWSSLHHHQMDPRPQWLASWPISRPFNWISVVNVPQTPTEIENFRGAMINGMPFGDEEWRDAIRRALGNKPQGKTRGRPRKLNSGSVLEK
jgi:putative transposase